MRTLIKNLYRFLQRPDPAPQQSLAETYRLFLDSNTAPWTARQTMIILHNEAEKLPCYLHSRNGDFYSQTLILGLDLDANTLLLDEPFPKTEQLKANTATELVLRTHLGSLALGLSAVEHLDLATGPALLCQILDKRTLVDRRLTPRTYFDAASRPQAQVLAPLVGLVRGSVLDLSCGGFAISLPSREKPPGPTINCECSIQLASHMRLRLLGKVISQRSYRKPYKHRVVRFKFVNLNDTQRDQLLLFVEQHKRLSTQAA